MKHLAPPPLIVLLAIAMLHLAAGCARDLYRPELATRPYPVQLHTTETVPMQVFRDGTEMVIVNATPRSFHNVRLWLNQRFAAPVESIPAGATVRLSLWDFVDLRGDVFNAGGFFRTEPPTPLRLVEVQTGEQEPMVGLIVVRPEVGGPVG